MTIPAITQAILDGVRASLDDGVEPLVVLDLDATLYDNSQRMLRILQEFAHTHAAGYPGLYDVVHAMSASDTLYEAVDTLRARGIEDEALLAEVHAFWRARFFTSEYLLFDLPHVGGVEFVRLVYEAGGVPCYLTGRDAPNMAQGTLAALQRDGFPVATVGTRFILKPDWETPDKPYKRSVLSHLRRTGRVVGSFDNEPALCNLFKSSFPDASVVWLDTIHTPNAPPLREGVHAIRRFTELLPTDD